MQVISKHLQDDTHSQNKNKECLCTSHQRSWTHPNQGGFNPTIVTVQVKGEKRKKISSDQPVQEGRASSLIVVENLGPTDDTQDTEDMGLNLDRYVDLLILSVSNH